MEQLTNTKNVSTLNTETENLTGNGSIIINEKNELEELKLDFKRNTDKKFAGSFCFRRSNDATTAAGGGSETTENISEVLDRVPAEHRKEVRNEIRRLIDKYDGVTVISKEV